MRRGFSFLWEMLSIKLRCLIVKIFDSHKNISVVILNIMIGLNEKNCHE